MLRSSLIALILFTTLACQASGPVLCDTDQEQRDALFAPVLALEGSWTLVSEEHPSEVTFTVTSGGSAVRELMFPGTEHEMTNMYTLDGNTLVMTHYCGGGNQPTMRATAVEGNRLVFHPESVKDLREGYGHYMGGMTLVVVGEDKIEQHWQSFDEEPGDGDGAVALFTLVRDN